MNLIFLPIFAILIQSMMAASVMQRHSSSTTQLQKTALAKFHRKPAKYHAVNRVHPAVKFDPLTWMLFK